MQKQLMFVILAAVLLAAVVTVALYTVNVANAQGNKTSAGGAKSNMSSMANMTKNMTGANMAKPAHHQTKNGL